MRRSLVPSLLLLASLAALPSCEEFEGPPVVTLAGETNGLLPDPKAPLVVLFSKPIDLATLDLQIVPFKVDAEGNLPDEDADPNTKLEPLYPPADQGPRVDMFERFSLDQKSLTFSPVPPLPAAAPLALLIEPGLAEMGTTHVTRVRKRIIFSYGLDLHCNAPSKVFLPGIYFILVDVTKPIPTQVALWMAVEIDPLTGAFRAQFTKGSRNLDPKRCPTPCAATETCRLLPSPKCVPPSERAGTVDEFSDYVPNPGLPTGYTFITSGCAVDVNDQTATFGISPVDASSPSPPVTLKAVEIKASFTRDPGGTLRGAGSLNAVDVLLGTTSSGPAEGSVTGRSVPAAEAPAGIPEPPKK